MLLGKGEIILAPVGVRHVLQGPPFGASTARPRSGERPARRQRREFRKISDFPPRALKTWHRAERHPAGVVGTSTPPTDWLSILAPSRDPAGTMMSINRGDPL